VKDRLRGGVRSSRRRLLMRLRHQRWCSASRRAEAATHDGKDHANSRRQRISACGHIKSEPIARVGVLERRMSSCPRAAGRPIERRGPMRNECRVLNGADVPADERARFASARRRVYYPRAHRTDADIPRPGMPRRETWFQRHRFLCLRLGRCPDARLTIAAFRRAEIIGGRDELEECGLVASPAAVDGAPAISASSTMRIPRP